jgi:hypothetical protein
MGITRGISPAPFAIMRTDAAPGFDARTTMKANK